MAASGADTVPAAASRAPGTLGAASVIGRNDLRRRVLDKSMVIQGVVAPIALAFIVGLAFGGGPSFETTIGVADADGSPMSSGITQALVSGDVVGDTEEDSDGPAVSFVEVDVAQVEQAVQDEDVDAAIVLPAGLAHSTATGRPTAFVVVEHASQSLAAAIATSVAEGIAAQIGLGALATTASLEAAAELGESLDPEETVAAAAQLQGALELEPSTVDSNFSVISYFAPAMAILFLFFTLGAGARSIMEERDRGTLARMRAAPITDAAVLLGKTLSVLALGLLSMAAVWLVTWLVFRVDWGNPLGVAAVLAAVVVAIAGISMLITSLAKSQRQADALTTIIALSFALAGGSFFVGGGGWLDAVKPFTPNGQALQALTELSAGNATFVDVLPTVLLLLAAGVVTGWIGIVTLRGRLAR